MLSSQNKSVIFYQKNKTNYDDFFMNTNHYYFPDYFGASDRTNFSQTQTNSFYYNNDYNNASFNINNNCNNDIKIKPATKKIKKEIDQNQHHQLINNYKNTPYYPFSNENDLIYESLLKAYQSGSLSKSRYRRLIANERERRRMHGLNEAFANLRACLPSIGSNKQFSKYETLQMAKNYIAALEKMLN
jgi:hypothetical protein